MAAPTPDSARDLLLRKAKELFADTGYDGTSIRTIVEAAGVNVSLVSYYFGGKAGLYRECIENFGSARLKIAKEVLTLPVVKADVGVRLKVFVERTLSTIAADLSAQKIVASELDRGGSLFEDLLREVFLKIHEVLSGFLAAARQRKFIKKDLDPLLLASMLQGMIINEARLERVKFRYFKETIHDEAHRQDCARHILSVFLGGIET